MSQFEMSFHATEQCQSRGISLEIVFEVLTNPDKVEKESERQFVYQKNRFI